MHKCIKEIHTIYYLTSIICFLIKDLSLLTTSASSHSESINHLLSCVIIHQLHYIIPHNLPSPIYHHSSHLSSLQSSIIIAESQSATMQAQRCYFTQLPVELLNTVFTSITDLNTLANAALSCRSLYATFKGNEKRIIKEFLINHIGIYVLPEAILAYNCLPGPMRRSKMHLTGPSMDRERELMMCIADYLEDIRANKLVRPDVASLDFGMNEAFALANTHFYVVAFTERFLEKCSITTGVKLRQSFRLSPPSPAEKARIARAFYRFEFFRRLLALVWSESYDKECTPVLHQFQPWELCQLGCIHDFLAYEVIPGMY